VAAARKPWIKWYGADWRADPALRMCGFAARGLWVDMLTLMQEAEPFGFLVVKGIVPTTKQLASMLGGQEREVVKLLDELSLAGVFSETGGDMPDDLRPLMPDNLPAGVIFSRRMVRDKAKADRDTENGRGGGNPNLKPDENPPDNPESDEGVNPQDKAQRPEARGQKDSPTNARARASAAKPEKIPLAEGWQPEPATTETLKSKGYTDHEIAWQRDRFVAHFAGGERRPGWERSFHNWVTRDPPGRHDPARNGAANRPGRTSLVAGVGQLLASMADAEPDSG
jgi:hypothetical protein